jgi:hypothetical protein
MTRKLGLLKRIYGPPVDRCFHRMNESDDSKIEMRFVTENQSGLSYYDTAGMFSDHNLMDA